MVFLLAPALLAACAPSAAISPTSTVNSLPITGQSVTDTVSSTAAATIAANTPDLSAVSTTAATATTSSTSSSPSGGVKYVLVAAKSSVSYAVREQLARLNLPSDAIGTTNGISGQIVLNPDGSFDQANSKFTVDLSSLQTDSSMRDNYVAGNILQTGQYPQAVFVPTQATGLPGTIPQSGNVTFKLVGDLTIRNVTKSVTWDVSGTVNNGEATGTATTNFTFEYFNLHQPSVPVVLSVVDKITLTITLDLKPG